MTTAFDIPADLDTPVSAFLKLAPLKPRFLLESVVNGESVGRYSLIGFGACDRIRLDDDGLFINGEFAFATPDADAILNALRSALDQAPKLEPALPDIPFVGGLVGYASFELAHRLEDLKLWPNVDCGPLAEYIAPRSLLVFDHATWRIALLHVGTDAERSALRNEVLAQLRGPLPSGSHAPSIGAPEPSLGRDAFLHGVDEAKELIRQGEVYQLVLSSRFSGPCDLEPFQAYRALRHLNPSPYMYFLDFDDRVIVGSSPEALVKLHDRTVTLRPIAGTRPRGASEELDRAMETELRADPKEDAEHVMLVDLARNDAGRIAEAGSVVVGPFRSIERYSHVMHIVSGVKARVAASFDAFDVFAAAFPAGTVVGAPKIRAMQAIAALEPMPRGPYAGTVGYFGHGGTMDQAITIRTIVFERGQYAYQAGAGIVADSVPSHEFAEVGAKSAVMQAALEIAGGLE